MRGKKTVRIHPAVAEEFRKVAGKLEDVADENRRLAAALQDERTAREALERQEVHIDDMPGKQLPFKYQINIPLPGGSSSPVTGTVNINRDGPFICRRLFVSVLYTDAPSREIGGNTYDYTYFIGRYAPITSRETYIFWGNPVDPTGSVSSQFVFPPPLDFEWGYSDSGSDRVRQDKPISGDILTRQDDDGYLMNNELFAAGTTISFTIYPTREIASLTQFIDEVLETIGPVDIEAQVTLDGFKVLQPLEM